MNCAVFASGGGTNFQALLDRKAAGDLHVEFVLAVSNNSGSMALQRARAHNIPALHLAPSHFSTEADYAARLLDELHSRRAELIVLAGYMKMLPPPVVRTFRNRIVNIHPALLPAFGGKGMYGLNVHKAVLDYGAKVTGVTVHFVNELYDDGPVIVQRAVEVGACATPEALQAHVLALEYDTFWRAIEAIAKNRIRVEGRKVVGDV